jgi:hypothetical protein
MFRRRRFRQSSTLEDRLAQEATRLREEAKQTYPGIERDRLLRKARQAETAARIRWVAIVAGTEAADLIAVAMGHQRTVDPHSNSRVFNASKYASDGGGPVRNAARKRLS